MPSNCNKVPSLPLLQESPANNCICLCFISGNKFLLESSDCHSVIKELPKYFSFKIRQCLVHLKVIIIFKQENFKTPHKFLISNSKNIFFKSSLPNSGHFTRKKAPKGGEIQELCNAQLAKSPHQPVVTFLGDPNDKCIKHLHHPLPTCTKKSPLTSSFG